MFSNKWVAFGVGVTAAAIIRKPAFRKACAAVIGKGMQLKKDAVAFAESVKEEVDNYCVLLPLPPSKACI